MNESTQRSVTLAGFWRRFVAYLIDGIVVTVMTVVALALVVGVLILVFPISISDLMGSAGDPQSALAGLTSGLGIIFGIRVYLTWMVFQVLLVTPLWIGWLYFALMESSANSATLGKMAMSIVVSDRFGRRITFERATGRYFAKIITGFTFGVGYVMAAFSSRKQALHDIIAGCLLLYRGPADYYDQDDDGYEEESAA